MYAEFVNMGLAFFEGLALIISPCILPILPIILSGSLSGKKSRPLGIILGFIITFTIFTLFSRALVQLTHLNDDAIRNTSYIILLLLGVVMVSTYLTEKFNAITQRLSNVGVTLQTANDTQGGFLGGLIFGGLVGIIWTPCAGPILAAVIVQAIVQKTTFSSMMVVFAFAIGAALPMLFIALIGRKVMSQFSFFRRKAAFIRQLLGWIIIIVVVFLMYDSGISSSAAKTVLPSHAGQSLINGMEHSYDAPPIAGIDAWINSPPLMLTELKGKVVLIDFWTYSCINCIRTFPYLKDWYAKYHDKGFEIIGVHSPEFEFEHNLDNVKNAVTKYGIRYPVALDNHFSTWQNFHNEYWPAHYLINKEGRVVYEHFGEGDYDVTENNIRYLLGMTGLTPSTSEEVYSSEQTPETYLGYDRAERFSSLETISKNKEALYSYPPVLPVGSWALSGKWIIYPDKIVAAEPGAAIKLHFNAGKVYAVMGIANNQPVLVTLMLNGALMNKIQVKYQQLYTIVELQSPREGETELKAGSKGLEMYTFTFGS
jgi:cytochrome c biogenesis protein CcdA/thiol-disulfide isomerase/thioredoxin